jgi:hypothetical protein
MNEVCFCGWSGEIADREPSCIGDGEWGLRCPNCGQLDPLHWMPAAARDALVAEARRRVACSADADNADLTEEALRIVREAAATTTPA